MIKKTHFSFESRTFKFAFIYNFMTQAQTVFILQSYVPWSLWTVVRSGVDKTTRWALIMKKM